jgi:hypothetical protein
MGIRVNMAGVQGNDPVPIGAYVVAITKITPGQGEKGQYLGWEFTIQEGEFSGRKLWCNTSFSEKALWRLKQLIEAFQNTKVPQEEIDIEPEKFMGLKAIATVTIKVGQNDEPQNDIQKFKPLAQAANGSAPPQQTKRRI